MKPEDMFETHEYYDDYWMLRFLQDTPGLGYGIYRLCEVAEKCIRVYLDDGELDINETIHAPDEFCATLSQYMHEVLFETGLESEDESEDESPYVPTTETYWDYDAIVRSLRQRCNSTIALMEIQNVN